MPLPCTQLKLEVIYALDPKPLQLFHQMAPAIRIASSQHRLVASLGGFQHPKEKESPRPPRGISRPSAPRPHLKLESNRGSCSGSVRTSSAARDAESFFLEEMEFDVIVIGAGVIGLTVANQILTQTTFSLAVVDAKRPCAGATGAGQGYVWMNHRTPASKTWELAHRGKLLWEQLVAELAEAGSDPWSVIGWQNTGSLLVATSAEEARSLESHVDKIAAAGVNAEFLRPSQVSEVEPSLEIGHDGGAAFVPGDSQIDAALAVAFIRQRNAAYRAQGRYTELFESPVERLDHSPTDGSIQMVQTSRHKLHCREAVVVAAGAWSSNILALAARDWGLPLDPLVKPRKGHLLVVEGLPQLNLNHGLMEYEYTANYKSSPESINSAPDDSFRVAMTASMDSAGRLLVGSSREFSGFDTSHHLEAIESILSRASTFLPALRDISGKGVLEEATIRTGLRPYVFGGVPLIGPVPGVEGLMLATGHEGSGLCMALSTAEILVAAILGKQVPVNVDAYLPAGRLCNGL